jgi:hypothetical protein
MRRDTKRWLALLAGPVAVIGVAIAGAVYRPEIWRPGPDPQPVTFEERWRERVDIPLRAQNPGNFAPGWWTAEDGTLMPVQGLRPGLPFPTPVRTVPIKP